MPPKVVARISGESAARVVEEAEHDCRPRKGAPGIPCPGFHRTVENAVETATFAMLTFSAKITYNKLNQAAAIPAKRLPRKGLSR